MKTAESLLRPPMVGNCAALIKVCFGSGLMTLRSNVSGLRQLANSSQIAARNGVGKDCEIGPHFSRYRSITGSRMRRFILVLAIVAGAHSAQASCERATEEEKDNCLHWANLNLDWSPQLKRRRDEIIARIGQHFYAWREYGEGFTVLGIIDHDGVKVKYDHHLPDDGIHARFAQFPSQEWATKNPYAGKEGIDWREVLREFEKRCASGHPRIGMTQLQAYLEWCRPWTFHKTETARGFHEQWVYEDTPPQATFISRTAI